MGWLDGNASSASSGSETMAAALKILPLRWGSTADVFVERIPFRLDRALQEILFAPNPGRTHQIAGPPSRGLTADAIWFIGAMKDLARWNSRTLCCPLTYSGTYHAAYNALARHKFSSAVTKGWSIQRL
jgi:hypothetical protein